VHGEVVHGADIHDAGTRATRVPADGCCSVSTPRRQVGTVVVVEAGGAAVVEGDGGAGAVVAGAAVVVVAAGTVVTDAFGDT
jgi:hypothetical protein